MKFLRLDKIIKNKTLREWIEAIIFAVVVALVIRTWLFAPFRVPTGSMIPTILEGDHLIANMHSYGYVVPFTDTKLFESKVERGDIVIFPYPENPRECEKFLFSFTDTLVSLVVPIFNSSYAPSCQDYVKRAIGIGGDKIKIVGEDVWINGEKETSAYRNFDSANPPILKFMEIDVPEGKVFVMGDNRRNSFDSREWGFVDEKNVRARASFIYLSFDIHKNVFTGFRPERILTFF